MWVKLSRLTCPSLPDPVLDNLGSESLPDPAIEALADERDWESRPSSADSPLRRHAGMVCRLGAGLAACAVDLLGAAASVIKLAFDDDLPVWLADDMPDVLPCGLAAPEEPPLSLPSAPHLRLPLADKACDLAVESRVISGATGTLPLGLSAAPAVLPLALLLAPPPSVMCRGGERDLGFCMAGMSAANKRTTFFLEFLSLLPTASFPTWSWSAAAGGSVRATSGEDSSTTIAMISSILDCPLQNILASSHVPLNSSSSPFSNFHPPKRRPPANFERFFEALSTSKQGPNMAILIIINNI